MLQLSRRRSGDPLDAAILGGYDGDESKGDDHDMPDAPHIDRLKDRSTRQHITAALTWLLVRSPGVKSLDPESLTQAAGHLRAVAEATGLTPPQVCDVLRIHGWRRRGVMPESGRGYRFRMRRREALQARSIRERHPYDGLVTDAMVEAKPKKRVKVFRLTDAANDDPLAP